MLRSCKSLTSECKTVFCGGLTSTGHWSLCNSSSATQGKSPLMSWDFQMDQTPSPPFSLHCSLSWSPAVQDSPSSGLGCHLGLPLAAGSCSHGCYPRRCGPESGTECRTPLCLRVRGALALTQKRRRCRCQGSHKRCSGMDTQCPERSATSQRWSGLRQTSQSRCFEPEQCLRADAPGQNTSPDKHAGL